MDEARERGATGIGGVNGLEVGRGGESLPAAPLQRNLDVVVPAHTPAMPVAGPMALGARPSALPPQAVMVVDAVLAVLAPEGIPLSRRHRQVVVSRLLGLSGKAAATALRIDGRTHQGHVATARDRLGWESLDVAASRVLERIGGELRPMLDAILGEPDVVDALVAELRPANNAGAGTRK